MHTEGLGVERKPGREDGVTVKPCQSLCLVHQLQDTRFEKGNFKTCCFFGALTPLREYATYAWTPEWCG